MTNERYAHHRYLLMTLDPVHPGAGGYRLGRVDLSIAREPGTRLPKIPGSSLHGAARSYAAYLYEKPKCAGQGQASSSNHCGDSGCPICYTFGYLKGKQMSSGVVNVFDAQILLFPVHSMLGPVWVSTPQRLREAGFDVPNGSPADCECWTTLKHTGQINLGWLMLDATGQVQIKPPDEWAKDAWNAVKDCIVLVPDSLFSHIVNSNLEVRTSVAIDPQTGAAEEGALYTYEAIPRATFLTAEVVLDDYSQKFPQNNRWENPLDVIRAGLKMMEYLGVGGMGTRGFGRIAIVGQPVEKKQEEIFKNLEAQA
ncbi:MAG: type III-B CRISPR module RAMP protein Cmr4 [Anaerolineae bacterium]|nr:MAG: type III-B CRISPR module RAMP protein Cmr4 [Anaerolineae bacterium]